MVTEGHPDKYCDQLADALLDAALSQDYRSRVAVEALVKGMTVVISGEVTTQAPLDVSEIARHVWQAVGYPDVEELVVEDRLATQAPEIAAKVNAADAGEVGAGDQGIMIGYASAETSSYMPREYELARSLALQLRELRQTTSWLRSDGKTQITLEGDRVKSVVIAAQHHPDVTRDELEQTLLAKVVLPVVEHRPDRVVINGGSGTFTVGGPLADAGVVGRKVVVDAYGPRVPVGGGAYSGKDPTKVDRSAAYMARHIAKSIVAHSVNGARECLVGLAFAIGQHEPEMVFAVTDTKGDVANWIKRNMPTLSPAAIIERLGLSHPLGWRYQDTASYGHYGRDGFPWEEIAPVGS